MSTCSTLFQRQKSKRLHGISRGCSDKLDVKQQESMCLMLLEFILGFRGNIEAMWYFGSYGDRTEKSKATTENMAPNIDEILVNVLL